ncbi:MAG: 4-hydroxy-tetrahydrodipicolinate reductase, partial [Chthoniobacterales bacterium]|nr:4-hydroxy-tetrahydrodipicolinate reductase [Chthoniobacterales bacterium]
AADLGDDLNSLLPLADCVIDFSHPSATATIVSLCLSHRKRLVIGTTGQCENDLSLIRSAAESIPIVLSPNFSTGVNLLFWLSKVTAQTLGADFDIEIVEMHHRLKKDAPSGTAAKLLQILAQARNLNPSDVSCYGRSGITGERSSSEIGVHAIRGGDVVGDHTVIFATQGERLELVHKASNRHTFANGALRAAAWLADKPPGLYDMLDVLGLPR